VHYFRSRIIPVALAGATLVLTAWPAPAVAERYAVSVGAGSEVVFESRAPMEKFKGKTNQVSGWIEADLDDLNQPVSLEVRVDLASFDTGIGKRNGHMRENHFETDKYPVAVFSGGQISEATAASLAVGATIAFKLSGELDLHGVVRKMVCDVTLVRSSAETLQGEAQFKVLLPDHDIDRPKFLMLKLAEDQTVTVTLQMQKES
jgi:polyisoprenoid-binding protein YceI